MHRDDKGELRTNWSNVLTGIMLYDDDVRVPLRKLLSPHALDQLKDNVLNVVGDQLIDVVFEIEMSFPNAEQYWDEDFDHEGNA